MEREAIYKPESQEILVVRGLLDRRTVMWSYNVSKAEWLASPEPFTLQMTGRIIGAEFFDGIDERLANQKASIDRLLKHLKHHCPDLKPPHDSVDLRTICGYEEK
jgi:hypothetical protein